MEKFENYRGKKFENFEKKILFPSIENSKKIGKLTNLLKKKIKLY